MSNGIKENCAELEKADNTTARKKSVEDLLNGTQEVIGNSINQAISFTTSNVLQASPIPLRRSPSPTRSSGGYSSSSNIASNNTSGSSGIAINNSDNIRSGVSSISGAGTSGGSGSSGSNGNTSNNSPKLSPKLPTKKEQAQIENFQSQLNQCQQLNQSQNTCQQEQQPHSQLHQQLQHSQQYQCQAQGQQTQQQLQLPSKSDSHSSLFVNTEKSDNTEDSISKSSDSSQQASSELSRSYQQDYEKSKIGSGPPERAKKKSWYSVLYPSYKSRSEDFKKLFKDVPDDERLVVDYSCALQRDILIHGRLYASQNYLCFYANIFWWETCLSIKWKDVDAIAKEKTALVIPNAISVITKSEKHFFTSFTTRDNAYLMLFRVWQNVLMDKPMQPQEMWLWVHNCYGDELGLTSDDEDYIDPYESNESKQYDQLPYILTKNKSTESFSEDLGANDTQSKKMVRVTNDISKSDDCLYHEKENKIKVTEGKRKIAKNNRQRDESHLKNSEQLPTDMSDSSDSDQNKITFVSTAECTSLHEGRQLVHTILPINIDTLFTLLFSKSKFLVEFHAVRKSTDFIPNEWIINEKNVKQRTVNVTVALTKAVGPKNSKVTETQVMRECSQEGELYSIDIESVNAGIPYADSFYVVMHYCLVKTVDDHTMLSVHAQIKYKKSIWGVVKGFIEKNTWAGLDDFYTALLRALQSEYCIPPAKGKGRRPRRGTSTLQRSHEEPITASTPQDIIAKILPSPVKILSESNRNPKIMSWFVISLLVVALIALNVILLFKLWTLESGTVDNELSSNIGILRDLKRNHGDWLKLIKHQESVHEHEMRKWQTVLQTAVDLLQKVSVVCDKIVKSENLSEKLAALKNEL